MDRHLEHYGNPLGWLLMVGGSLVTWLADHGMSLFGLALGLFGAWLQWKTYRLREAEHAAKMRALEAKPCPGPILP